MFSNSVKMEILLVALKNYYIFFHFHFHFQFTSNCNCKRRSCRIRYVAGFYIRVVPYAQTLFHRVLSCYTSDVTLSHGYCDFTDYFLVTISLLLSAICQVKRPPFPTFPFGIWCAVASFGLSSRRPCSSSATLSAASSSARFLTNMAGYESFSSLCGCKEFWVSRWPSPIAWEDCPCISY